MSADGRRSENISRGDRKTIERDKEIVCTYCVNLSVLDPALNLLEHHDASVLVELLDDRVGLLRRARVCDKELEHTL